MEEQGEQLELFPELKDNIIESFGENGICAICRKKPVTRWCDYIVSYDNGLLFLRDFESFKEANAPYAQYETCDLPMCTDCSTNISNNRDLCKHHASLHSQSKLPDEYQRKRQKEEKRKILFGE